MLFKSAVKYLPHYVWWKDKNYTYQGCNKNFADILDLDSPEEILGKTDQDIGLDAKSIEKLNNEERLTLMHKEARKGSVHVLSFKNNPPMTMNIDFVPYFSETGKIMGVLIFAMHLDNKDLTNNIFFIHMLEHLPYYIFWKDANSTYLGCNENFANLIGVRKSYIVGKTDYDLKWGEGEAEQFTLADKAVMGGKKQVNVEETLFQPDGSKIVMLVSKTPVYNQDKQVIGLLGISVDITRIKLVEEELLLAKERAEKANQAKVNFLDNMRHDIRTPLSNIVGAADYLKTQEQNSEYLIFLDGITASAHSLLDFLTNLLKFNSLDSGKEPVKMKKFSLQDICEKLTSTMNISAIQKKLEFGVQYDEKIPKHLIGDEFRIYLILLNLLSNAFKFTKKGHVKLVVKLEKMSHKLAIISFTVEDTGIGIAPENHDIIFDRFEKIVPSYTGIHKGEGLGLNIVKQFIEELEGEIEVESDIGKGSIFRCIVPFKIPLLESEIE